MADFEIVSNFNPSGDQPRAINELVDGINSNIKHQTLLGVTGSGKTYTIAKVIEKVQRPTLVISHNKTLAAQLYGEFKSLFPNNAVEYFISTTITISQNLICQLQILLLKKISQWMKK